MAARDGILNIRVSDAEKRRLAELARADGRTMAQLIRWWIANGDQPTAKTGT